MTAKLKMQPMERLVFDSASLTVNYQTMSAAGLDNDAQIFKMVNDSNVDVDVSYDGVVDHEYIPAGGSFILDLTTNAESDIAAFPSGMQVYLKSLGAGVGNIYAMAYSQRS